MPVAWSAQPSAPASRVSVKVVRFRGCSVIGRRTALRGVVASRRCRLRYPLAPRLQAESRSADGTRACGREHAFSTTASTTGSICWPASLRAPGRVVITSRARFTAHPAGYCAHWRCQSPQRRNGLISTSDVTTSREIDTRAWEALRGRLWRRTHPRWSEFEDFMGCLESLGWIEDASCLARGEGLVRDPQLLPRRVRRIR